MAGHIWQTGTNLVDAINPRHREPPWRAHRRPPAASTGRDDREVAEGVDALAFWQVVEQARKPTLGRDAAGAGVATITGSNKGCMQQGGAAGGQLQC